MGAVFKNTEYVVRGVTVAKAGEYLDIICHNGNTRKKTQSALYVRLKDPLGNTLTLDITEMVKKKLSRVGKRFSNKNSKLIKRQMLGRIVTVDLRNFEILNLEKFIPKQGGS